MEWTYFVLGVIFYQIIKMIYRAVKQELRERRERRFLKMISIAFPDKTISYISIDSSDKRTMQNLERKIREDYHIPEEPKKIPKYRRMSGSTR